MSSRTPLHLLFILGLIVAGSRFAFGQVVVQPPQGQVMASADASDSPDNNTSVFVRDSAIALEKLALARRMERLHEWNKSADVYQEILEKYPDRVVRSDLGNQIQYTSVTETVRQSICKWPDDGLAVYRARYETTAASMLDAAGQTDLDKLHRLFSLYFPTDSAKAAGIRLMDAYFEQGDYAAVAQIGQRLLQWHPNLIAERPMVLFRTALAEKLTGQLADAQAHALELRQHFPQATGSIRGQDTLLPDALDKELGAATLVRGAASDSWLTVGGDESRSKLSASIVKPGARLYSIPVSKMVWHSSDPNQKQQEDSYDDEVKKGAALGIMPASDRGELFFQDNVKLYAVDMDSGQALPGWEATYPLQNGAYKLAGGPPPVPLGKQECVSLSDKYVTAVMGQPDPTSQGAAAVSDARLVCLDRHTGRELWNNSLKKLPDPQSAVRDLQLSGAPLIVGENIYCIAHGDGQFEDCYVVCYSLPTGQFRWASFIANASGDQQTILDPDGSGILINQTVSHLAYASGHVFVVTNLGAVASLDAYTGTVAWLDIYRTQSPAIPAEFPRLRGMRPGMQLPFQSGVSAPSTSAPWISSPAVVQNGRLFIMPSDSPDLFVYDAASGALLKHVWLSDLVDATEDADRNTTPDTLLAVDGDTVYLSGSTRVWAWNWKLYDHDSNKAPAGNDWFSVDYFQSAPAQSSSQSPAQANGQSPGQPQSTPTPNSVPVRGHGFVTADAVYIPTAAGLERILRKNGELDPNDSLFPRNGWDESAQGPGEVAEGPGNVIAMQDHVVVAGSGQVAVYTDISLAQIKLNREIAQNPTEPEPRLHYAEVMFVAGQTDVALQKLQDAFELLGAPKALRSGQERDRAFGDAVSFAGRLSDKKGDPQTINKLFDLASAAASSPAQLVSYHLARAKFAWSIHDAADAILLYQQILADPVCRKSPITDPQTGSAVTAGSFAQNAIAEIIATPEGHAAYDSVEHEAEEKVSQYQAAGNAAALLEVARAYPNAKVARLADLTAAGVFEASGDFRMAAQVLRRLLASATDQDRYIILESIARNYLKLPGRLDVAAARLALAAAAAPPGMQLHSPLVLPDGRVLKDMDLASAAEIVRQTMVASDLATLPDLHIPTNEQARAYAGVKHFRPEPLQDENPATVISNVDALVTPDDSFHRNDAFIAWDARADHGLSVYAVGQATPLFNSKEVNQKPLGAAWINVGLAVWTQQNFYLIDSATGKIKWSLDVSALPPLAPPGAAADASDATANITSPDGSSPMGDTASPQTPPQGAPGPEQIAEVKPLTDRIAISTSSGRVLSLQKSAGKIAWQKRLSEFSLDTLLANDDFVVARFQQEQAVTLLALDTYTGDVVGRKVFFTDSGSFPLNMALSNDGLLVYSLPTQLCVQDLFQTGDSEDMQPTAVTEAVAGAAQPFQAATQPGQLLVYGGRIYAISNQGLEARIYYADTAKPWQYSSVHPSTQISIDNTRATSATSPNVTLSISGNYLFALGPSTIVGYRIDPPTEHWIPPKNTFGRSNYEQAVFGKDYLIVIDRHRPPLSVSNRSSADVSLRMLSRIVKAMPDKESGNLVFTPDLKDVPEPIQLQPVSGGIVYFSGGAIHTRLGSREAISSIAAP
jgi:outer membrane protein assembly factor BamB